MLFRVVSAAVFAASVGAYPVAAQSVGGQGGPRELPPAGYAGQQYVDSNGCVFLRAGYGGQVTWVQRVSADRKPICGYPPSIGGKEAAAPAGRKPLETVATTTAPPTIRQKQKPVGIPASSYAAPAPVNVPKPVAAAAPAGYQVVPSVPGKGKIGCYRSAPVPVMVRQTDGKLAVMCTPGDGSVEGWRQPIYPVAVAAAAPALKAVPVAAPPASAAEVRTVAAARPVRSDDPWLRDPPLFGGTGYAVAMYGSALSGPPPGYVYAWKDGRLNPARGRGTQAGQLAQDQVWTRKVPAELVVTKGAKKPLVPATSDVTVSTKSLPAPLAAPVAAPAGGVWIQVGSFGVTANAEGAAARLGGIGLPVAKARLTRGGKDLQNVAAGPFATLAEAQGALAQVRRAGFADAFIR